ncbi:hypothetical protein BRADI_1g31350v3 [Brachypodium distachyon]|uniref:Glutamate receptor n=1 Tax=Brachypodium distachyon TaxID=15368 RepID=A0A0Q3RVD3_BRADI|nr:hypothetical protein BRADI_1g31350v3 [Brachypodium distachyon]
MEKAPRAILFLLLIVGFGVAQNTTSKGDEFHVGVILDLGTLAGKVARTSISLAVEDFYSVHRNHRTKLVLHIRDSMGSDVQAASAAIELLENYKVQAIVGPQKSSEVLFISNIGNITQVPIVSFTATSPSLTSDSMPYFVRATLNDSAQVNSIALLIKAYGWREVVPVYEDTDYGRGILPSLIEALQEIDARVPYRSVTPSSATSEIITQELYKLKAMQTRVFIVHMSPTMTSLFFTKAKEAGMMNKGFVWITTDGVANIIDSLDPSVIEAMNGVLGVRYYVPKSQELDSFTIRWNRMYQRDNPDESPFNKLSIVGLWGYDMIRALAQAAEKAGISSVTNKQPQSIKNSTCLDSMVISTNGPDLLTAIVQNKFRGISGDFDLTNRQLTVSVFQIINVVGRGWREIGFWTVNSGLSRQFNQTGLKITGPALMIDLNPVIWPGESTEIPRGWEIPTIGKKLRVGVRTSIYPEFIETFRDHATGETRASGLSVEIFEEAVKRLPFALTYEYLAFDTADPRSKGSYDDFVNQVYLQKYDIAVADTTIRCNRSLFVDFTVPYTESGVLPKNSPLRAEISRAILNITESAKIIQIEKKWVDSNSHQNDDKTDGSDAITFESFGGLFLLTGIVTACSLFVAVLMNGYKKYQQNGGSKGDNQNECGHEKKGEDGDSQGEQRDPNINDMEKQATLPVSHSLNTNGDQLPDSKDNDICCRCTQNNKATSLTHIGSQIIHRGDKSTRSSSGSKLVPT